VKEEEEKSSNDLVMNIDQNKTQDSKPETEERLLKIPLNTITKLSKGFYNRNWFNDKLSRYSSTFESSMISPVLLPILPVEEKILMTILDNMSLKEKLGQLFILDLKNRDTDLYYTELDDGLKDFIGEFQPGGVILFSKNIYSNEQVSLFLSHLQSFSEIPLFTAVDQEGGRVARLNNSSNMVVLKTPSHQFLGTINDPLSTWEIARITGESLKALGFNMNLAPVADINSNPDNPVLGDRSFSGNSEIVSRMVKPYIQGLHESGVMSVVKHFPGHGDTSTDPHSRDVSINLTLSELQERELLPFYAGIAQGTAGVMTAHIKTPMITGTEGYPVSISFFFIQDFLREKMNFDGIVISDSFSMAAIENYWTPEESASLFIAAGGDIILRPSNAKAAMEGLVQSLKDGMLSEERINESVLRILAAKYRFGLFSNEIQKSDSTIEEGKRILNEINSRYEKIMDTK
jgi:beta-N-acetylhexosaminidase